MEVIKATKIVGVLLLVLGLGLLGGATIMSEPPTKIEKIGEFNKSYAESVTPSPAFGSYTGDNISAEDIHTVYNSSELSNDTFAAIERARDEGVSTIQEPEQEIIGKRFIVEFDDGSKIVFSASPSGITPSQTTLTGLLSVFAGIFVLSSLRGDDQLPSSVTRASDDSRWEYEIESSK